MSPTSTLTLQHKITATRPLFFKGAAGVLRECLASSLATCEKTHETQSVFANGIKKQCGAMIVRCRWVASREYIISIKTSRHDCEGVERKGRRRQRHGIKQSMCIIRARNSGYRMFTAAIVAYIKWPLLIRDIPIAFLRGWKQCFELSVGTQPDFHLVGTHMHICSLTMPCRLNTAV